MNKGKGIMMVGCVLFTLGAVAVPAMAENPKVAMCGGCHGADGKSPNPDLYPHLAGQSVAYLVTSIKSYKPGGTRTNAPMQAMVGTLSDQDITELAEHYASQPLK